MSPLPGVQITTISREIHTPYSGMLPGLVAGHYQFDEAHIDLGPLCRFAGARLYHDEAVGLDFESRRVLCRNRPPVPYDVLSINIGSTPRMNKVSGATENITPVKPISNFITRWERLKSRVLGTEGRLKIAVVGAGAGGVEILLSVQYALQQALQGHKGPKAPEFDLFSHTAEILPSHNQRVSAKFVRVLGERGIHLHTGQAVVEVGDGWLQCENGLEFPADEVLWVTEAGAPVWLRESGLAVDSSGFICVNDALQSISHEGVFAAGDIASVMNHPRAKAGVFAVRQGRPLLENLRRALQNRPTKKFVPQNEFLGLISTGDKYAVASRGSWCLEGQYLWRLKDWIDRRFVQKYNNLPERLTEDQSDQFEGLASPDVLKDSSFLAMRCGGCGSKVGSDVLTRVLGRLNIQRRAEILIGIEDGEDAAVIQAPAGRALVQTVDFFRSIVDDPYVFGKIAANHCLGDIYAMGASPMAALAVAVIPFGLEDKIEESLEQMLRGAVEVLEIANTTLVGGHTSEGADLGLGFAVTGYVDPDQVFRKSGMQPGDHLILTKPLGTGTLFAADMRLKAKGRWILSAIDSMLQSNLQAAECLRRHGATACTDVTGFGLLGHLVEMVKASGVDARLFLTALPILDGALETVDLGIFSSLQPQNLRLRRALRMSESIVHEPGYPLIFDPQTAGGFLASLPPDASQACLTELHDLGYHRAAVIGEIEPRSEYPEPIHLTEHMSSVP